MGIDLQLPEQTNKETKTHEQKKRLAINQSRNKLCCRTFWKVPESTPKCNGSILEVNFEQTHQQR